MRQQQQPKKTVDQILRSDPFYDPTVNLDLSSHPSLVPLKEESFLDPRFGGLVTESKVGLRDVIGRMAAGDDVEVRSALQKAGVQEERIPILTLSDGQEIVPRQSDGKWIAECVDAEGQILEFTAADWRTLLVQMDKVVKRPLWHDLSEEDKVDIQHMITTAGLMSALETFILRSLSAEARKRIERRPSDMLTAEFLPLKNLAVLRIFEWSNETFRPSAEWDERVQELAAEKPLTISLLVQQWQQFRNEQQLQNDREIIHVHGGESPRQGQPAENPEAEDVDLESLSDSEIASLTEGTLKKRARQIVAERRGQRIIV